MERRRYLKALSDDYQTHQKHSSLLQPLDFMAIEVPKIFQRFPKKEKVFWQMCVNNGNKVHKKAKDIGIRVIHPRIGIVISGKGGALAPMKLPFSLGLGGPMGSGQQYMSWISIDDILDMFLWMLTNTSIEGVVNLTNPNPVTNRDFSSTLGRVLRRPALIPAPSFALQLILGEMAQGLILDGAKVLPKKAMTDGFPLAI